MFLLARAQGIIVKWYQVADIINYCQNKYYRNVNVNR